MTGQVQNGESLQVAVDLAVEDVNDGGGINDRKLEVHHKDTGTDPDRAMSEYRDLVNENAIIGLVGAFSSAVSVPLAKKAAGNKVMQVSPGSTSPVLSDLGYSQNGLKYFGRTAPSDAQQGLVMGRVLNEDSFLGAEKAAFLYVDNPYGRGLAGIAEETFDGKTVAKHSYTPNKDSYSSTLDSLYSNEPDAVALVGYPGSGKTIVEDWWDGDYGGNWVLSESLNSYRSFIEPLGEKVDGMYITTPQPEETVGTKIFEEKLKKVSDRFDRKNENVFTPNAYDALFLMALAMVRSGAIGSQPIARNIRDVSMDPGTKVTVGEFGKAKNLLEQGEEVNYQGASGPVNLNQDLEPLSRFAILRIKDGERKTVETLDRKLFETGVL